MLGSIAAHVLAVAVLWLLGPPLPEIAPVAPPSVRVLLTAPPKLRDAPRSKPRPRAPAFEAPRVAPTAPIETPPLPEAPRLKAESPQTPLAPTETPRLEAPPPEPARPAIAEVVAATPRSDARRVQEAGFGVASASPAARTRDPRLTLGAFQEAAAGASAASSRAEVRQSGFGSAFVERADGKPGPAVQQTGFGSATVREARKDSPETAQAGFAQVQTARAEARPAPVAAASATRPVEILVKPQPVYTAEARARRLEGDVTLEVRFGADGSLEVMRVLRGLGGGLDEAAVEAVRGMKFRPATSGGSPVDKVLNISVAFRLAY